MIKLKNENVDAIEVLNKKIDKIDSELANAKLSVSEKILLDTSGFRFSVFLFYFLFFRFFVCFFVRGSVRHNFPLVLSNKFLNFRQFIYSF